MRLDKQMGSRKLHISVKDKGLFSFDRQAATGKSYLIDLVTGLDDIYTVTYNKVESVLESQINEALSGKYKLVILDRCDLYMTKELYGKLENLSQNTTVVMDLKNFYGFTDTVPRPVQVILKEEMISLI